ncbi:uncharacterized protein LOC115534592 [Gadus morhua]|uniref:uncharacterized protein LOC115534592 n=1 Tax=Gadus morhua TaxID=8049 RepID=UPI0011B40E0A|nr:uncharacterized protein LOC115534592 [Gadus morhua]
MHRRGCESNNTAFCGAVVRMERYMLKRKQNKYVWNQSKAKKAFASFLKNINPYSNPGMPTHQDLRICHGVINPSHPCETPNETNGHVSEGPSDADALLSRISSWVDTRYSARKALEHFSPGPAAAAAAGTRDTFLSRRANERFLELHRDFGEECGPGSRQHSWAALETRQEVVMYGPYYPDYARGEHSEDPVVRQTEELLGAEGARARGASVYIFTQNSPCLDRDTQPCMLLLVEKALEWHALYGVTVHIGYARCWGFKGNKEALFRVVDRSQLECVGASRDHASYVEAMRKSPEAGLSLLSEELFSAVRRTLGAGSEHQEFSLRNGAPEPNWKSSFRDALTRDSGGESEIEREALTREVDAMTEAAQELVSDGGPRTLGSHMERGRTFAQEYGLASQTGEAVRAGARLAFLRCWRDVVETRYAEFIRDGLTDDFNRCVTHLFSEDVVKFDKEYIQIGRIRFSEEFPPSSEGCLLY